MARLLYGIAHDRKIHDEILIKDELWFFINTTDPVLVGSGTILRWVHSETAFDLTEAEWKET
jgi:hypothetical protein